VRGTVTFAEAKDVPVLRHPKAKSIHVLELVAIVCVELSLDEAHEERRVTDVVRKFVNPATCWTKPSRPLSRPTEA
jgi:hypothetical protein